MHSHNVFRPAKECRLSNPGKRDNEGQNKKRRPGYHLFPLFSAWGEAFPFHDAALAARRFHRGTSAAGSGADSILGAGAAFYGRRGANFSARNPAS